MSRRPTMAACIGWALVATVGLGAQPVSVPVKGGSLVIDHPRGWKSAVSGPSIGPTLTLTPGGGGDFEVLITALVSRTELPGDEALARQVRSRGEELLPTAVQTTLEMKVVKGAQARGYLYHLTERKAEQGRGDFRELHQGVVVVRPLLLSVTVLTHTGDAATVKAALEALASARFQASH
jgi:hypothetical protein